MRKKPFPFSEKVTEIVLDFFEVHGNFPNEITCEEKILVKDEYYSQLKMIIYKDKNVTRPTNKDLVIINWDGKAKVKPRLKLKK